MKRPAKQARQGSRDNGGKREAAEALAIAALSFLAAEPERLGGFLALTGIGPESIRDAAGEPHFLAGVLDHVVSERDSCWSPSPSTQGIDPVEVDARPAGARRAWERDVP